MMYKGFVGEIEYDDECNIFTGMVINTKTVITFQGTSVDELTREFQLSIDDYLEWCRKDGIEPEKPYSGKFNVRLKPDTHQRAAIKAKTLGISLNSFIEKAVEDELAVLNG
ncbi:MAG: type II toxin-antitoxin system HicB family antitoxin [Lachnospiraceae bacterium]|nr:type II toxin-antitoxin system HicB family antitoxin [Lachnospiraceae bacterium]